MTEQEFYEVVIIGAGVAGLSAAQALHQRGMADACVLEALQNLGGRVRQVHGVVPWPLEAGPEFVHGTNSYLVQTLRQQVGMKLVQKEWPDKMFWGDIGRLAGVGSSDHKDLDHLNVLMFDELPQEALPEQDISVRQWLHRRGASAHVLELADACYANDFGTSLSRLGLREAILEARSWDAGEEYLLKDRSFAHLVAHLSRGLRVRRSWPVRRIDWQSGHGARIHGPSGTVINCKHLICAVPLSQLQKQRIAFQPALDTAKLQAISRVHMGNAVKVWAAFSQQFWPRATWDVVCAYRLFPEVWMCAYTPEGAGLQRAAAQAPQRNQAAHCVTAFVCGDRAAKLSACSDERKVQLLVQQLDDVFGGAESSRPASDTFVRGAAVDWSQAPYIEGAYTSPSLGAHMGDRNVIAQPQGGVLFFAGEHTHPAINPCLQAAMDTGDRAAAQVLQARAGARVCSKL